jgi:hypothetical protein
MSMVSGHARARSVPTRPERTRYAERSMTTDSALNKLFKACDATLREAYRGASISGAGQAKSRTCTNRETLVRDLFERMLPVATRSIHGSVFIDAHGGESGDVDVAIVAPWGAPIWPFQTHPLVPCEGVIAGVFCEASNPGSDADVWRQIAKARALFKCIAAVDDPGRVPRGRTPNLGLWCWSDGDGATELAARLDAADDASRTQTLTAKAKTLCPSGGDAERYAARVLAVGAHTPNWIYWHGTTADQARFAFRVHRCAGDPNWNTGGLMPGFDTAGTEQTRVWRSSGGAFEWSHIIVSADADDPRALKALVAYLSTQVVTYGNEVPHYGAYAAPRK